MSFLPRLSACRRTSMILATCYRPSPPQAACLAASLSALILCACIAHAAAPDPPLENSSTAETLSADELYRRASECFYEARFPSAVINLEQYLSRSELSTRDRIRGLELQGACHIARSEPIAARRAVEAILDLDPTYVVSPETVFPPLLRVFFSVLKDRGALALPPGIRSIAVVPLENTSITEHQAMDPLGLGIAQAIITDIVGASDVRVVERERLHYALEEINMPPGAMDRETAARAGRLVGAQSFLMGSFTRIGDRLRVDVRLVETETGVVIKTRSLDGKMRDVFELVHELSKLVVADLGDVYTRPPSRADASLKALIEYAAGLDLLDRGRYAEAEERLQAALAISPDYEEARRLLRQLRPMLATVENR